MSRRLHLVLATAHLVATQLTAACELCGGATSTAEDTLSQLDTDPADMRATAANHSLLLLLLYSPFCRRSATALSAMHAAVRAAKRDALPPHSLAFGTLDATLHPDAALRLLGEPANLADAALPAYRLVRGDPSYGAVYRGGYSSAEVLQYVRAEVAALAAGGGGARASTPTPTRVVGRLAAGGEDERAFWRVGQAYRGIIDFELASTTPREPAEEDASLVLVRERTALFRDEEPTVATPRSVLFPRLDAAALERWVRWAALPPVGVLSRACSRVYLPEGASAIVFVPAGASAAARAALTAELRSASARLVASSATPLPLMWMLHAESAEEHERLRAQLGIYSALRSDGVCELAFVWMVSARIGASFVAPAGALSAERVANLASAFLRGELRDGSRIRYWRWVVSAMPPTPTAVSLALMWAAAIMRWRLRRSSEATAPELVATCKKEN